MKSGNSVVNLSRESQWEVLSGLVVIEALESSQKWYCFMQNTVHYSSSELMSSELDGVTQMYPECVIAFFSFFFWTQRILNEGKGMQKKNWMFMQITNSRKKQRHTIGKFVLTSWKQFLSADWLFTVYFAVNFQIRAKKPLCFLITFLSRSCLVSCLKFPCVAWHYRSCFLVRQLATQSICKR